MAATRSPTVPAPITRAVLPGVGEARFREWIATERGSRREAASKETLSGILLYTVRSILASWGHKEVEIGKREEKGMDDGL